MSEPKKKTEHEKSHLQSKKFVAFLVAIVGYFILMGIMLYQQDVKTIGENVAFMILVVTSGFLVVGYCLGQAYVDRYIRVALITMGKAPPETEDKPPEDEGAA